MTQMEKVLWLEQKCIGIYYCANMLKGEKRCHNTGKIVKKDFLKGNGV